jgi:hypothetical protein
MENVKVAVFGGAYTVCYVRCQAQKKLPEAEYPGGYREKMQTKPIESV